MKIEWEGKELEVTQDPYIDGVSGERPYYRANAVDAEGNEYEIIWDVVDAYEEIEDESDMCDWNTPCTVTLLNELARVYTAREAEQSWGLGTNTVTKWIERGKFTSAEHRKSGGTWLVTRAGMERLTRRESK